MLTLMPPLKLVPKFSSERANATWFGMMPLFILDVHIDFVEHAQCLTGGSHDSDDDGILDCVAAVVNQVQQFPCV